MADPYEAYWKKPNIRAKDIKKMKCKTSLGARR
jgi:hypothetical protein